METGLVSIDFIGKYYSVNIDIEVVKRQYSTGPELNIEEIQRILKDNGFRVKHKVFDDIDKVWKYPMPFIFRTKKGLYNIFLKTDKEDKFLILDCTEKTTKELNKEGILRLWDGNVIIFYPRFTETIIFLNFKWLFNEFFRFKSIFSEAILSSFLIQLFGLVTPLFMQLIIDKVLTHQALSTLKVIAGAFLIVIIFDTGLNLFRNYILYHTANKIDSRLGSKVYRHLLSLPYVYFETRKIGTIIARVRELENLRQFMTNISLTVLLDSIFAVVFIVIMCVYSLQLTLITLIFLILIAIISIFATPIIKAKLDDKFQKGAVSQSFLVESITGVQTVKALAIEGKMIKDWENNLGNYINSAFKLSNVGNITFGFSQMLQKLMTLAIIYFGVSYVFSNKLSVGQLIAFQMFAGQLSGPILRLVHSWQDFQQAKLSMERLGDIINTPSEITKGDVTVSNLRGEIVLKDISFKYRQDGPMILNNISFGIPQGTMIGIVGRSGSGKSTVAKLIQKIYLPLEGSIFIDKIDIRNINPILLRYKIGVVLQDNFLFSGTIKENLSLVSPNASMENIIRCSQLAGSHNFITEMPMGYETQIEEGGRSLSGGQKQRIAIARALLTNPKILIFDEATSALDYESEKIVLKNLNLIKKNKTVVIIAHRLAVMKNCDFVIVLDKGRIVEVGKHDELLNKNGLYAFLYKQQEE